MKYKGLIIKRLKNKLYSVYDGSKRHSIYQYKTISEAKKSIL